MSVCNSVYETNCKFVTSNAVTQELIMYAHPMLVVSQNSFFGDPIYCHLFFADIFFFILNYMAKNSFSGGIYMASARSDDPAWAHEQVVLGAINLCICVHCNKRIYGDSITRLKYHLVGIESQVEPCKMIPPDVKWQIKQLIKDLTMEKKKRKKLRTDIENFQTFSNDEVEEGDDANPNLSEMNSQTNKILTM